MTIDIGNLFSNNELPPSNRPVDDSGRPCPTRAWVTLSSGVVVECPIIYGGMEDITGSSAFGEVARSIIGFAEQAPDEPLRIVEQVKNSVGPSTLRMNYRLTIEDVDTDDGMRVSATRFELAGPSDLSIADLGGVNDEEADQVSANIEWLQRYLEIEQPAPSAQVKRDAKDQAGIGENALHRARKKLKVKSISMPRDKAPHSRSWCLPDWSE